MHPIKHALKDTHDAVIGITGYAPARISIDEIKNIIHREMGLKGNAPHPQFNVH